MAETVTLVGEGGGRFVIRLPLPPLFQEQLDKGYLHVEQPKPTAKKSTAKAKTEEE